MHPDDAFNNFIEKIYAPYAENLEKFNEADTRAKIIDFMLRDCLGWDEKNIKREDSVESGRTDYQLIYTQIQR